MWVLYDLVKLQSKRECVFFFFWERLRECVVCTSIQNIHTTSNKKELKLTSDIGSGWLMPEIGISDYGTCCIVYWWKENLKHY